MQHLVDRFVPRAYPIGIDFGASGAKVVQVARGSAGLRVVGALRLDWPEPPDPADPERGLDPMLRLIARRIASGGFRGRRCIVSIDDRLLRTRAIRQPRMPDAEVDAAVRLDAAQRLGFAEDEPCEVGWIRAGEVHQGDDVRDEIIYLGCARRPLERLAMGLAASGLRPVGIEPGFVAAARCFGRTLRRASDRAVVRVIVDVGYSSTGVLLTRGAGVAFYKPLELGGADLIRVAAERLGLEPQTVDDLRRRRMAGDEGRTEIDPKVDRALYDAVRPLLGDLAHEVNLCVRHYCVTFRGSRPGACLIVGGEAPEPRLAEAVQDALQIDTGLGNPLEGIALSGARLQDRTSSRGAEWGVAAGLSLRPMDLHSTKGRSMSRRRAGDADEDGRDAPVMEARRAA